jgi:hypothetical protein
LQRRVRLLVALHPALAREDWELNFCRKHSRCALASLATSPPTTKVKAVLARMQHDQTEWAAALAADWAQDRGLLADLALDEARHELLVRLISCACRLCAWKLTSWWRQVCKTKSRARATPNCWRGASVLRLQAERYRIKGLKTWAFDKRFFQVCSGGRAQEGVQRLGQGVTLVSSHGPPDRACPFTSFAARLAGLHGYTWQSIRKGTTKVQQKVSKIVLAGF